MKANAHDFTIKSLPYVLLILLSACSSEKSSHNANSWQIIAGRNELPSLNRPLVYRAKIPETWQRIDPPPANSIQDTRLPLVEFLIAEEGEQIRLTVHNFPTSSIDERVPPAAQIARWKKQFDTLDMHSVYTQAVAKGGFSGLYFEASGRQKSKEIRVIGWSLQLAQEHFNALSWLKGEEYVQMRSDYTIKAVGPSTLVSKHKNDLIRFAQSFELINEIPSS